jgi:hypothetical protein
MLRAVFSRIPLLILAGGGFIGCLSNAEIDELDA